MITASAPPGLRAELAAVEHDYPRWHCWLSDAGVVHATACTCPFGGSGTTLEAPNPQQMRRVIAETEHQWGLAA